VRTSILSDAVARKTEPDNSDHSKCGVHKYGAAARSQNDLGNVHSSSLSSEREHGKVARKGSSSDNANSVILSVAREQAEAQAGHNINATDQKNYNDSSNDVVIVVDCSEITSADGADAQASSSHAVQDTDTGAQDCAGAVKERRCRFESQTDEEQRNHAKMCAWDSTEILRDSVSAFSAFSNDSMGAEGSKQGLLSRSASTGIITQVEAKSTERERRLPSSFNLWPAAPVSSSLSRQEASLQGTGDVPAVILACFGPSAAMPTPIANADTSQYP